MISKMVGREIIMAITTEEQLGVVAVKSVARTLQ
jgi:hypothetical protein